MNERRKPKKKKKANFILLNRITKTGINTENNILSKLIDTALDTKLLTYNTFIINLPPVM